MIRETVTHLDPDWGELVDIDVLESSHWAGLFRMDDRLFVRTEQECTAVPYAVRCPMIRSLDRKRFVVVDTRTQKDRTNAWVLSTSNDPPHGFFAGDGIQDVLAANDTIVVTYFDEGVFGGIAHGDQGVALFNGAGDFQMGYRSAFGTDGVDVADCYAACLDSDSRIVFFPCTSFALVRWDLGTGEQTVTPTPGRVHGSSAIAVLEDKVLFFGPYGERTVIFEWLPGQEPAVIGSHPGPLRGLRGGRFLAHGANGFTIVEKAPQQGVAAAGASPRR